MAMVEHIDPETGEVSYAEQDLRPVELGGATRLQKALGSAVRREFEYVNDSWHPGIEQALVMTRDRCNALLKGLLAEAMLDLSDAVKPQQLRMGLADKHPARRS